MPGLIGQLAARGTRAAVVISTGFGSSDDDGDQSLRQALLDAAQPHLMRILGPHSLGLIAPREGLNASFSHLTPPPGRIAFVAQSGSIISAVLDWAHGRGIGFSRLLSLGDMADVDFGDLLDYLASDPDTHAILLHMESVTATRKFMSAARMKPVIVVKSGRYAGGNGTTTSLLGTLAGTDAVYDAAFRRSGMLRVDTLGELFAAVETLALAQAPPGEHLAILINSAGMGLFASDALIERGGRLAELSAPTLERLRAALPPAWPGGNPVDLFGDASGERYAAALEALITADEVDAVLALNCPNALADPGQTAQALIDALAKLPCQTRKPLLTAWVGGHRTTPARQQFAAVGLPSYSTPEAAVRAFMHMIDYRHNQRALLETPPSIPEAFTPGSEHARGIVATALDAGREWLSEAEAKDVLAAYGVSPW